MEETETPRAYSTPTTDQVLQVLLQRADLIQHMRWFQPPTAPWKDQRTHAILLHHNPPTTQTPALPTRIHQPQTPTKRAPSPQSTTPSSSTKQIKTHHRKPPTEENQHQHSSASTMEATTTEATTTSSSPQTSEEETEPDSEDELLSTWAQILQEAQKSLPRTLKFSFSNGSFSIASATVSKQRSSMELELTNK
jgi:hypothetical protein